MMGPKSLSPIRPKSLSRIRPIQTLVPLMFAAIILTIESGQAQVPGSRTGPRRPSISTELVPGSLAHDTAALSFRISVEVPREHHGYLDRGDDGFFIPFSFSFPDFEGTDVVAEMTSAPSGTRDDGVRAQVLRGRGEFAFELAPGPEPGAGVTAMLRYQICNDLTDRCYPPARLAIPIVGPDDPLLEPIRVDRRAKCPVDARSADVCGIHCGRRQA